MTENRLQKRKISVRQLLLALDLLKFLNYQLLFRALGRKSVPKKYSQDFSTEKVNHALTTIGIDIDELAKHDFFNEKVMRRREDLRRLAASEAIDTLYDADLYIEDMLPDEWGESQEAVRDFFHRLVGASALKLITEAELREDKVEVQTDRQEERRKPQPKVKGKEVLLALDLLEAFNGMLLDNLLNGSHILKKHGQKDFSKEKIKSVMQEIGFDMDKLLAHDLFNTIAHKSRNSIRNNIAQLAEKICDMDMLLAKILSLELEESKEIIRQVFDRVARAIAIKWIQEKDLM